MKELHFHQNKVDLLSTAYIYYLFFLIWEWFVCEGFRELKNVRGQKKAVFSLPLNSSSSKF